MKLIYILFLLLPLLSIESSLINPNLSPEIPGYDDFIRGQQKFEEKSWKKASYYFSSAIKKSYKPYFICKHYTTKEEGDCDSGFDPCTDTGYYLSHKDHPFENFIVILCDNLTFYIQDYTPEIRFAIDRHFYRKKWSCRPYCNWICQKPSQS